MRRVAFTSFLLVMAAVAPSASAATTGVRAQTKSRITSAASLPVTEKRLSPERNATQPQVPLPSFSVDPTPYITEFYGPAQTTPGAAKPAPEIPSSVPEAAVRSTSDGSNAR